MAKPLLPFIRGDSYLANRKGYIPFVLGNGFTRAEDVIGPPAEYDSVGPVDIATFTTLRAAPLKSLTVAIEPVQSGSGDPAPDNVRPISGWTEANVWRTGVNVWDEEVELGKISYDDGQNLNATTRLRSKNYISVKAGEQYYIKSPAYIEKFTYDANKNFRGYVNGDAVNKVWTVPDGVAYVRICIYTTYGTTYNNDISINYPSTDHDYHAYYGTTVTIDLDGTRYGGTLDVLTGVLTVDRRFTTIGSENVSAVSGTQYSNFQITLPGNAKAKNDVNTVVCISSALKGESFNSALAQGDNYVFASGGNIRIKNTANAALTADEWKELMKDVQLCYVLATPITYQLTPEEVTALLGANNVWADTGDVTVEYRSN